MAESPSYLNPEKGASSSDDKKTASTSDVIIYPVGNREADEVEFGEVKELRRGLGQRHILMIALAGTNGAGLFLGSGKTIASGGPLGACLGYALYVFALIYNLPLVLMCLIGLLNGSRSLYGMAQEGHAPKIFLRTNRFGIPYVAVCFLGCFITLGCMTLSDSASTVFGWLQDLVSVMALVHWIVICTVYLRFYYGIKAQGIDRKEFLWKEPFQPYAAWVALISFSILLFFGGYVVFIHGEWDTETFVSSYINILIILILYLVTNGPKDEDSSSQGDTNPAFH